MNTTSYNKGEWDAFDFHIYCPVYLNSIQSVQLKLITSFWGIKYKSFHMEKMTFLINFNGSYVATVRELVLFICCCCFNTRNNSLFWISGELVMFGVCLFVCMWTLISSNTEQSLYWEASSCLVRKFSALLMVHFNVHKRWQLDPILSQINPVHTLILFL
jgi:hypothetical protein